MRKHNKRKVIRVYNPNGTLEKIIKIKNLKDTREITEGKKK